MEENRNYKKEIADTIQEISGKYNPYQIFRDWCEMYAISIQNSCVFWHDAVWQHREDIYNSLWNKYDEYEHDAFVKMTCLYAIALQYEIGDLLGEIFMESGAGSASAGQFFTPFHVSEMVAKIGASEDILKEEKIHMTEPSIGSGGMVIATAKYLKERGINYQKKLKVVGQDLDWLAVYMSYIQLSLLGIDAIIVQGDTLSEPYVKGYPKERTMRTPMNTGALIAM